MFSDVKDSDRSVQKYPLAGVRVLEFGHVAAGPFAGMLLADLGADVVKVEPPDGDDMRQWPPLASEPGGQTFSHNFAALNRNKRSVTANLKESGDLSMVLRLCEKAHVIIENYRPGVLERLGLGYEGRSLATILGWCTARYPATAGAAHTLSRGPMTW